MRRGFGSFEGLVDEMHQTAIDRANWAFARASLWLTKPLDVRLHGVGVIHEHA